MSSHRQSTNGVQPAIPFADWSWDTRRPPFHTTIFTSIMIESSKRRPLLQAQRQPPSVTAANHEGAPSSTKSLATTAPCRKKTTHYLRTLYYTPGKVLYITASITVKVLLSTLCFVILSASPISQPFSDSMKMEPSETSHKSLLAFLS